MSFDDVIRGIVVVLILITGYTILLWATLYAMIAGAYDAMVGLLTLFACFVASGLPMYQGEIARNRDKRQSKTDGTD